jgi:hypothetical protein
MTTTYREPAVRPRLPLASTLTWLRNWAGATQLPHPGAADVAPLPVRAASGRTGSLARAPHRCIPRLVLG